MRTYWLDINSHQFWSVGQDRSGKEYRKNQRQMAAKPARGLMNSPGARVTSSSLTTGSRGSVSLGRGKRRARFYLAQKFFG